MNSLVWKRRFGWVRHVFPRTPSRRLVLLYHSVGDSPWAVAARDFKDQVRWLQQHARVENLETLLRDDSSPGLRVAITFDDGYASLADTAAEILHDADMVATVYLNTAFIDEMRGRPSDPRAGHYPNETFLTWAEVRRLADFGWTIGSHGREHLDLTAQRRDRVAGELTGSRQAIETRLSRACSHFSYTWGRQTPEVREAVREAGYEFAAAAVHGPVPPGVDRFALPRINVHHDYTIDDFAAIVRGDWDFLGMWQTWRSRRN